ncbi:uncharacterized protein LOC119983154 isoform X2 [Tripterygium wilfordii]|uniref:uncharacterized protein LOC119983154 isoform X2 n=1 Tax=Tripterygium wilfordii TaxID=458696 RepID=UPI0018F829B2|nr:uncharacterized protein LOC119983154 isoform X2 [Tripterygium wilfordii]
MLTMDLKGITWVGHVYQKFESMCLEMEEAMYQDTVKYVENQVQTVGANVKRFYSDVMQDLLPSSEMDPVKVPVSDLAVGQKADIEKNPKLNIDMKQECVRGYTEKFLKDSKMLTNPVKVEGQPASSEGLCSAKEYFPSSERGSMEGACSDLCAKRYCDGSDYKKPNLDLKEENSWIENHKAPMEKDFNKASLHTLSVEDREALWDQQATNSTPEFTEVSGRDFIYNSTEIENSCKHMTANDNLSTGATTLVECDCFQKVEMNPSACPDSSTDSNGNYSPDVCTDTRAFSLVESLDGNENDKFADQEDYLSHLGRSDDTSMDEINGDIAFKQGTGTIQFPGKLKLEESCVLVDNGEPYFASQKEQNRKSCTRKIRNALSSRIRSTRKHEYKQLALRYGGADPQIIKESSENPTSPPMKGTKTLTSPDFCESEWELL